MITIDFKSGRLANPMHRRWMIVTKPGKPLRWSRLPLTLRLCASAVMPHSKRSLRGEPQSHGDTESSEFWEYRSIGS